MVSRSTFTATVTASSPGSGTPTGTVTFMDGTTAIGTGTLERRHDNIHDVVSCGRFPLDHGGLQLRFQFHGEHLVRAHSESESIEYDDDVGLVAQPFDRRPVGDVHGDDQRDLAGKRDAHWVGDVLRQFEECRHRQSDERCRELSQRSFTVGRQRMRSRLFTAATPISRPAREP